MGWAEFIVAFGAFFVIHSVPLRPAVRARLTAALGKRVFTIAYSTLSLAALIWLIGAAGRAPFVALWARYPWQAWVPLAGMGAACVILAFAIGRANPFSFGGAGVEAFDPTRPGIVRYMRHPVLVALALWAGAHLVPNGDLAHVLLFGVFAGFALLGMGMIDRRRQRSMGPARWHDLRDGVRAATVRGPASWRGVAFRLTAAFGLYAALLALHPIVLGVSPLP